MQIVASKSSNNQQKRLFYWQRKVVALIQRQSEGRFLANTQKRLVRRWQGWQTKARVSGWSSRLVDRAMILRDRGGES